MPSEAPSSNPEMILRYISGVCNDKAQPSPYTNPGVCSHGYLETSPSATFDLNGSETL
jgi:hypothetical protein